MHWHAEFVVAKAPTRGGSLPTLNEQRYKLETNLLNTLAGGIKAKTIVIIHAVDRMEAGG
jgi:hypothetical protein